jgi:hypothetical protein
MSHCENPVPFLPGKNGNPSLSEEPDPPAPLGLGEWVAGVGNERIPLHFVWQKMEIRVRDPGNARIPLQNGNPSLSEDPTPGDPPMGLGEGGQCENPASFCLAKKRKSECAKAPAPGDPPGIRRGVGGTARIPFRFCRPKMEIRV